MQAVKGYFENGRFTPHETVTLPKKAEVMLIFQQITQPPIPSNNKEFWAEFDRLAADSSIENDLLNDEAFSRRASGRELITFTDEDTRP